ncbi:MAG: hypothetical protein V5A51_11370, partial [Bacteroidales bacterium]
MQTLKTKIPDRPDRIRLIPVPSEKLEGEKSEYTYIQDGQGNYYKILAAYTFARNEVFPTGLMLMATGKVFSHKDMWQKYSNSNYLYFFVCE